MRRALFFVQHARLWGSVAVEHKSLGFMQLTIICGFALFYAWYLISFFGVFLEFPIEADFIGRHIGQILFFAVSLVITEAILITFRHADNVAVGRAPILVPIALIAGSLLPVCVILDEFGIVLPFPAFHIACALSGITVAIGFMLWEDLAMHGHLRRGVLAHGIIFSAGGVVFLLSTAFLTDLQLGIVGEAVLCASAALLAFITPRCDLPESKPVKPTRDYLRGAWHIDIVSIVINCMFGFAFIILYQRGSVALLSTMAIAVALDLLFSNIFGRGKWIPFVGAIRVCGAAAACALLLFTCPGEVLQHVALCIIVVFWFIFRTVNGGSLTDLAMRNGFSVLYTSTRGKMAANLGFTLGLVLGVIAAATPLEEVTRLYIPIALAGAFILAAVFLLPFDATPSTIGYKTLALVDLYDPSDSDNAASDEQVQKRVAEVFKLSPRESDVLEYVIRGRNAKHVAEKLYISESTAKTHISNIYRKAGVHSQQQLLDLIDAMKSGPGSKMDKKR